MSKLISKLLENRYSYGITIYQQGGNYMFATGSCTVYKWKDRSVLVREIVKEAVNKMGIEGNEWVVTNLTIMKV